MGFRSERGPKHHCQRREAALLDRNLRRSDRVGRFGCTGAVFPHFSHAAVRGAKAARLCARHGSLAAQSLRLFEVFQRLGRQVQRHGTELHWQRCFERRFATGHLATVKKKEPAFVFGFSRFRAVARTALAVASMWAVRAARHRRCSTCWAAPSSARAVAP
jgi:hypothetical protein